MLTPKQEKFCQLIVSGKNPSEAYIGAYSPKTTNKNTIRKSANRVLHMSNISPRIHELREKQEEVINYTMQDNFKEIDKGLNLALEEKNINAYLKAVELKGKLLGFYEDKKQQVTATQVIINFDNKFKGL